MNKSIGYITGEEFMELAAVQGAKVLSAPKSLHRRIGKVNIFVQFRSFKKRERFIYQFT